MFSEKNLNSIVMVVLLHILESWADERGITSLLQIYDWLITLDTN